MLGNGKPPLEGLSLRDVWMDYNQGRWGRRSTAAAVRGVSLDIAPGEIVGLGGESGSGKSSIARIAVGLTKPTSGSLLYGGKSLEQMSAAELRTWRREVQVVFQDPARSLNPRKTVAQTLALPLRAQRMPVTRQALAKALDDVGLQPADEYLQRYPHQLSGGQRQRVAIARAMILQPRILVADEPVSALDVSVRAQILLLIKELSSRLGVGVLLIGHDLGVLRYTCSRVAIMRHGEIVEEGDSDSVFANPQDGYTRQLIAAMPKIAGKTSFSNGSV